MKTHLPIFNQHAVSIMMSQCIWCGAEPAAMRYSECLETRAVIDSLDLSQHRDLVKGQAFATR